jgi:DNA-binding NarL/FixJ family response regulator
MTIADDSPTPHIIMNNPFFRIPNHVYTEAHTTERVRSYLEKNLGCSRKECARALGLTDRTISRHVRIIRSQQKKWELHAPRPKGRRA